MCQILTIYTSYDVFPLKDVPFGVCVDIASHFRGHCPQSPQFWSRNRHFPAKHTNIQNSVRYYQNHYSDYNQILHNDKDLQMRLWVVPKMRPTNPRWQTGTLLKMMINHDISRPSSSKCDKLLYMYFSYPLTDFYDLQGVPIKKTIS